MNSPARIVTSLLLALAGGGCGYMMMDYPPVARPPQALRAEQRTSAAGRLRVVCVVAAGHHTLNRRFAPEAEASRAIAEQLQRAVVGSLVARGVALAGAPGAPPRGYAASAPGFDAIGVSPYQGASYFGRLHLPAYFCVDDSLLRDPPSRAAWAEVLTSLRRIGGHRPRLTSIARATTLRGPLDADALLLVVARAHRVPAAVQVEQALGYSVLTLGLLMPYHDRSSTLCNAYLLDLGSGEVLWAEACLVDGADARAAIAGWSALRERW